MNKTVHDLLTLLFLKSHMWPLEFQGPHLTIEKMMLSDHELFLAAHVFISCQRRRIERLSETCFAKSEQKGEGGNSLCYL